MVAEEEEKGEGRGKDSGFALVCDGIFGEKKLE